MTEARRIAVVGGGYAGMAAAVELTRAGAKVQVFEASRTLGGRARAVELDGQRLDNGAHILAGAYAETLRLMHLIDAPAGVRRHPLHLEYPGEMRIVAPTRLSAPLHLAWALISARGLSWTEKLAAIGFMNRLKAIRFRLAEDVTAAALLAGQPARLRRYLWEPLCLATLNTPAQQASAQVFANVLRDTLGADRRASDMLLPVTDLSALFPEPAARYVETHGGQIKRGTRVQAVARRDGNYYLDGDGPYEQAILAVAPYHLPALIGGLPELAALSRQVAESSFQPIVTCYLRYAEPVRLPWPMVGVAGGNAQWLFDLGALRQLPGTIAAVISARGPHQQLEHGELAARIHDEIVRIVPGLAPPVWHRVVVEQRATFDCTPGLRRPPTATALPGLWLAGDYVASDYPATIETAVRSGVRAATSALEQAPSHQM
jgi:hydroxysqualene dehydroxylase